MLHETLAVPNRLVRFILSRRALPEASGNPWDRWTIIQSVLDDLTGIITPFHPLNNLPL